MRPSHGVVMCFALVVVATDGCTCAVEHNGGDDDREHDAAAALDAAMIDGAVRDAAPPIDAGATPWIPPDCLAAANRGLAWLVLQQNPDGSFGSTFTISTTALAVLKLETYAAEFGLSPFDESFVYRGQVIAGLDYLLRQARFVPLTPQLHGNPDGDGNTYGVYFGPAPRLYEQSMATMALAAAGEPARIVTTAGSNAMGLTFRVVVQDAVDFLAMAQSDSDAAPAGGCRGGWRYSPYNGVVGAGDNSVSQWATLALEYAHHPLYRHEIPIQSWVMTEVSRWAACVQNHGGGIEDGGGGYDNAVRPTAYLTGALLQQLSFLGETRDSPNAVAAQSYLQRVWADSAGFGWRTPPASNYLAMYSVMKGMESMGITQLGQIDWYRDFCDQLKLEQLPDGSWPASLWEQSPVGASGLLSTVWALLVLERAAPPPEVVP